MTRTARTVLLLVLLPACGGRSPALPAGDGGAGDQLLADTRLPDTQSPDSGLPAVEGLIYLSEVANESGAQQGSVFAFFTPRPIPFFSPTRQLGSGCAAYPQEEVGQVQFSAGVVSITGGPYNVTLTPIEPSKPDDWLYPGMLYPELFSAETTLTVSAAGGPVPAFSGSITGVDPAAEGWPAGAVSRSGSITHSFAVGSADLDYWVVLIPVANGKQVAGTVRCVAAGEQGQLQIPAAALGSLPSMATQVIVAYGWAHRVVLDRGPDLRINLLAVHLTRAVRPLAP